MALAKFGKAFDRKVDKALKKMGETIAKDAAEIVRKEAGGAGQLADSYKSEVKGKTVRIFSDLKQSLFVEYGTGFRGDQGFKTFFNEKKPQYTIPIKPVNAKALHWEKNGEQVFVKSTKGLAPIAPLRRAAFAFMNQKLKGLLKTELK